jgi:hypothetical protein
MVADTRLIPAERVFLLGVLSRTWPDRTFSESARDIAKLVCVGRRNVGAALAKWRTGGAQVAHANATYVQFTGTSEAISVISKDLQYSKNYTDTTSVVSHSEDSTKERKAERKRSGEEEREAVTASPTLFAEIYGAARKRFGEQGAAIIGRAERQGWTAEQIRQEWNDVVESGGDVRELAYALWTP